MKDSGLHNLQTAAIFGEDRVHYWNHAPAHYGCKLSELTKTFVRAN